MLSLLLHLPHDMEHWSADLITSNLSPRLENQHPEIALVYISNETLKDFYYNSPIDRVLLSSIIRNVDAAGARVIGLDIILDRHSDPLKDQVLQQTLANTKAKMVLGVIDVNGADQHIQANYINAGINRLGFSAGLLYFGERRSSLVVSDHVVRLMNAAAEAITSASSKEALTRPTFAESLASAAGREAKVDSPYISWLLKPKNRSDTFLTLSGEEVLHPENTKLPLADLLHDKIVLIGGNFDDRDQHLTPLSVSRDDFYPGLFIHAQVLAQLLAGRAVHEFSHMQEFFAAIIGGLLGFFLGRRSGHHHIWLELGLVVALVLIAIFSFTLLSVIVPYNLILLAVLAGAAVGHYGFVEDHS